jgi:hypothetical protein
VKELAADHDLIACPLKLLADFDGGRRLSK